jgi:hypothetical protein
VRSSYPVRKVSVIPTKLQFTILDSARDMVAGSQKGKCELKYDMQTPRGHSELQIITLHYAMQKHETARQEKNDSTA